MSGGQGQSSSLAESRLNELFGGEEWETVLQGVELARSLGSSALARFTEGISIGPDGSLVQSAAWARSSKVQAANRDNAALLALSLQHDSPLGSATALNASGMEGLTDIRPLEMATCLEELRLNGCGVSDLSPLSELVRLKTLSATGRARISQLPRFSKDAALERLSVENLDLADLGSLGALQKLRILSINGSSVSDLSALAKCQSLERLRLSGCEKLVDLEPLAKLGKLRQVALARSTPSLDMSPIAALGGLKELQVVEMKGIDVSPFAGLSKLKSLDLSGSAVRHVESLRNLRSLCSLTLPAAESYETSHHASYADDVWTLMGLAGQPTPEFEGDGVSLALHAMIVVGVLLDKSHDGQWLEIEQALRPVLELADPRLLQRLGKGLPPTEPVGGAAQDSAFMAFSPLSQLFRRRKYSPTWSNELASLLREFVLKAGTA